LIFLFLLLLFTYSIATYDEPRSGTEVEDARLSSEGGEFHGETYGEGGISLERNVYPTKRDASSGQRWESVRLFSIIICEAREWIACLGTLTGGAERLSLLAMLPLARYPVC
jgi:hypothetical protein